MSEVILSTLAVHIHYDADHSALCSAKF